MILLKSTRLREIILIILLAFMFNLQVYAQLAKGHDKFLGNTWSAGTEPGNFAYYWNQVTPGNSGKWASCEQKEDDFNYWLWLDRTYNAAKKNNQIFKEHTLFWGHSSGQPGWICALSQEEQKKNAVEWLQELSERYPDFYQIDVVNEPLHAPPCYTDALGGEGETGWDWLIWCYEQARKYFPDSMLLLNEYNILAYDKKCDEYIKLINLLKNKKLIDGIGVQGHSLENVKLSVIAKNMDKLAALGLPIYLTEYECNIADDSKHLAVFKEQFSYFWEHPMLKGITFWGYIKGDMWRQDGYLVSEDGKKERPALKWLRGYLGGNVNETPPPTPTPTPKPTPEIVDCSAVSEWKASETYQDKGNQVKYNGLLYENNWYTVNTNPAENSGPNAVWSVKGTCDKSGSGSNPDLKIGDTNNDGMINIVDALLIAQYYVQNELTNLNLIAADTNCDKKVDIVDALLVAQYYVKLITDFC